VTALPTERLLTDGEVALCRPLFGAAIDYDRVRVHRRRWWRFQPRDTIMAPDGAIWCHPQGTAWREDYAGASPAMQALFVHEMTHVWQAQKGGRWYLPLIRHPFCRYDYVLTPGKPFARYGIEQQAEIVRVAFEAMARGDRVAEMALLPFGAT
jgi:hypothetical protein